MSTLQSPARHAFLHSDLNHCSLHCPWRVFELLHAWGTSSFIRLHCWNDRLSIDSRFFVCVFLFFELIQFCDRLICIKDEGSNKSVCSVCVCVCFFPISDSQRFLCQWYASNQDRRAESGGWSREYPVLVLKSHVLEMLWSFLLCHILCICPFFSLHFCRMPFLSTQFYLYSFIQVSPPCPLNYNDVTALSEKWG